MVISSNSPKNPNRVRSRDVTKISQLQTEILFHGQPLLLFESKYFELNLQIDLMYLYRSQNLQFLQVQQLANVVLGWNSFISYFLNIQLFINNRNLEHFSIRFKLLEATEAIKAIDILIISLVLLKPLFKLINVHLT